MKYSFWKVGLIYVTALTLLGCGFHLRNEVDLPKWLNRIQIVNQGASIEFVTSLKNQFENANILLTEGEGRPDYQLILIRDGFQQEMVSVSSSTTPRQYQLTYTLTFKLQSNKSKEIIPTNTVLVVRQLTINSDRILGSNAEESLIKNEMRQDAIIQLFYRLNRQANNNLQGIE